MKARSLLALALAALLAPAAASAATRAAPAANALSLGGWLGFELGDVDGFQLRADGELPFQQLTPELGLSLVGSLSYTIADADVPGADSSLNRFKIVPAVRFTFPLTPDISLFGDAGLGIHYTTFDVDYDPGGLNDIDDSSVGLMLRFAGGAFFQVAPNIRVGGQVVIDPMFGDNDDTTFSILGGAMFTL